MRLDGPSVGGFRGQLRPRRTSPGGSRSEVTTGGERGQHRTPAPRTVRPRGARRSGRQPPLNAADLKCGYGVLRAPVGVRVFLRDTRRSPPIPHLCAGRRRPAAVTDAVPAGAVRTPPLRRRRPPELVQQRDGVSAARRLHAENLRDARPVAWPRKACAMGPPPSSRSLSTVTTSCPLQTAPVASGIAVLRGLGGALAGVAAALLPAVLLPAASASSASDLLEAPASENQAGERCGNREGGGLRPRRVRGTVR